MRPRPHRTLPLLLLLAVSACAVTPRPMPVAGVAPGAAPQRLDGSGTPAVRRGGGAGMPARGASGRGCGASVLDSPVAAQRLMAATFAEGPREAEARVMGCRPVFRAL
ncbi:MAG: hypothetical protein K2X49_22580 [Acetobacteraceae bacterium]|nr:hypothetical protein [Acetobacteraceae bacterium]